MIRQMATQQPASGHEDISQFNPVPNHPLPKPTQTNVEQMKLFAGDDTRVEALAWVDIRLLRLV